MTRRCRVQVARDREVVTIRLPFANHYDAMEFCDGLTEERVAAALNLLWPKGEKLVVKEPTR